MRTTLCLAAAAALCVHAGQAHAQVQGELGATSTGSLTVSATVSSTEPAAQVRISGLENIDLGVLQAGVDSIDEYSFFCLFHTSPTFSLTVSQAGVGGFQLIGPSGASLSFDFINIGLGAADGFYTATNGLTQVGLRSNRASETCLTGQEAAIHLRAQSISADLTPGQYSASISLVMAVE